jgi:formylglycine-generating enzyme required for sulfatase activity
MDQPTITISGTPYQVIAQLADAPTHRAFRVESDGRSYFLKVFRQKAAVEFDKQVAALAKVKTANGLLLPIETGEFNDERFVLRKWVEGEDFDVYTRRFKFTPKHLDEALAVAEQLARAVAALHEQGTAHGRLKNENVFFDNDYDPVVTDPSGAGDPRDDVRQIGLLLCRLYTRKPTLAINSRTLMELSNAKVPMNLLKVLWQAIQDEPSQRFKDAATLATALKEVPLKDHEKTVDVRAVSKAQGLKEGVDPRLKWGLAVVILIAAAGGGTLFFASAPSPSNIEPRVGQVAHDTGSYSEQDVSRTQEARFSAGERRILQLAPGVEVALRWIPPGSFLMGSGEGVTGSTPQERPVRAVQITQGFWMAETETTVAQFAAFVDSTGHRTTAETEGKSKVFQGGRLADAQGANWRNPGFSQSSQHPVVCVSWGDATAFADWLSQKTNVSASLPTEAQWEYAARGGSSSEFSTGDGVEAALDAGWFRENSDGKTQPVATKAQNAWGLYDMHGNAWEWCADWFQENYQGLSTVDPVGVGSGTHRVGRGGSWNYPWITGRSAARDMYRPQNHANFVGFRVVMMMGPGD